MNTIRKKFKYCNNCGSDVLYFFEERGIKCKKCGWLFFLNPVPSVSSILKFENTLLFVRRAQDPGIGKLDLPGGFIEFNESAIVALIRELNEELKLEPKNLKYISSFPDYYEYSGINYPILNIFFEGKVTKKPTYINKNEIIEVVYLDSDNVRYEDFAFPSVKCVLKEYLNK